MNSRPTKRTLTKATTITLIVDVLARSIEDYERFPKKVLLHLPGVGAINSSFALKQVKMTTAIPV